MHLILIAILFGLLLFIFLKTNTSNTGATAHSDLPAPTTSDEAQAVSIAFLSNGKLFHKSPGVDTQQISSHFVQELLNREERRNSLHSWKQGTSFDPTFMGKSTDVSAAAAMSFKTAEFVDSNTLIYFLSDGHVGGLFEYNLTTGEEKRLLHQQNLDLDDFHYDAANDRILCSSGSGNGIRNIAAIDRVSNEITYYTEGDTIDAVPCSYLDQSQKVVMQSSGIGRNVDGHMLAVGPASLNLLSTDSQQLEPVVNNDIYDFMQPVVHPNGDLYYIRRPFGKPTVSAVEIVLDIVLFPFRLARAFFHYFNFFSLMYTQKPLTTAAGPKVQRDRKDIIIQGKRIDAEKAQRQAGVVRGVPSLVPKNWQLVSRNRFGQETVVAKNVVSFDISANGDIIYTNGFGVFELSAAGPDLLFRDSVIEKIIVH